MFTVEVMMKKYFDTIVNFVITRDNVSAFIAWPSVKTRCGTAAGTLHISGQKQSVPITMDYREVESRENTHSTFHAGPQNSQTNKILTKTNTILTENRKAGRRRKTTNGHTTNTNFVRRITRRTDGRTIGRRCTIEQNTARTR